MTGFRTGVPSVGYDNGNAVSGAFIGHDLTEQTESLGLNASGKLSVFQHAFYVQVFQDDESRMFVYNLTDTSPNIYK